MNVVVRRLLDTNVVLDVLLEREPFAEAQRYRIYWREWIFRSWGNRLGYNLQEFLGFGAFRPHVGPVRRPGPVSFGDRNRLVVSGTRSI